MTLHYITLRTNKRQGDRLFGKTIITFID